MWQAIIGVIVLVMLLIFLKEKPKTPPSASSDDADEKKDVWEENKKIMKDKNFIKLIVTFGILFGTINTYGTIIGIITNKFGYSDDNASLFGAVFIIGGLIGCAILGAFVEVTRKYKTAMIMIGVIAVLAPLGLMGTLFTGEVWPVCIGAFVLGFDLAILPVGIDFGVEITYPIAEPISTGLLMSFAQLFGIVTVISCTALVSAFDKKGCVYAQCIMIVLAAVGLVFAILVKSDLKRLNYEK